MVLLSEHYLKETVKTNDRLLKLYENVSIVFIQSWFNIVELYKSSYHAFSKVTADSYDQNK